jgi:hypothetical protein
MGEKRNTYSVLVWKPDWRRPLEVLHVGGRMILK